MPDLSDLAAGLLSAWFLHATFIESFPPGRAAFLSSSFVRATEHTLRQYQDARNRLERASREEALMEFLRGCNDLEFTCIGLHKAIRLAEALMHSRETKVTAGQLPPSKDRDRLRKVRNAIDHDDEPIMAGRAGSGESLSLEVGSHTMNIADRDRVNQVLAHNEFAGWIRVLHGVAIDLIEHPSAWVVYPLTATGG